ncbi:MAG: thioredoxin family protein [Ginsengibacter sp.]
MEKKVVFAFVACFFVFSFAKVKPTEKEKINWLSMDQLNAKMKAEPKPVLIDIYTDWCYWCKVMDKKTYNNSKVISYINQHFYAARMNAETKDPVKWNNKSYQYDPANKVNDFALYATRGQLAFPNTVIFPEAQQTPAAIPGFMEPKEIEVILKYFGEGAYKTQNFNEYSANFKAKW